MAESNHLTALVTSGLDQTELELVLLTHFGQSSEDKDGVCFGRRETGSYVLVTKSSEGRALAAKSGPALTTSNIETVVARIEQDLRITSANRVGRTVLLSSEPIECFFRYKDRFQIIPVPPDAPRSKFLNGPFPFVLEMTFSNSSNASVRNYRRELASRETELLCSALFPFQLRRPQQGFTWSVAASEIAKESVSSSYCYERYVWPTFEVEVDDFSSVDTLKPFNFVPSEQYSVLSSLVLGKQIALLQGLEVLLDAFWKLSDNDHDDFLRSAYWLRHAYIASQSSSSAAYLALTNAVEALLPEAPKQGKCDACKRDLGPGPTRQFSDFVERYAPAPQVSNADRQRFYATRSALTHGSKLLESDTRSWGYTTKHRHEFANLIAMGSIVQVVLLNWLNEKHGAQSAS